MQFIVPPRVLSAPSTLEGYREAIDLALSTLSVVIVHRLAGIAGLDTARQHLTVYFSNRDWSCSTYRTLHTAVIRKARTAALLPRSNALDRSAAGSRAASAGSTRLDGGGHDRGAGRTLADSAGSLAASAAAPRAGGL